MTPVMNNNKIGKVKVERTMLDVMMRKQELVPIWSASRVKNIAAVRQELPKDRPHLRVKVAELEVVALADTGASMSLIRAELLRGLKGSVKPLWLPSHFKITDEQNNFFVSNSWKSCARLTTTLKCYGGLPIQPSGKPQSSLPPSLVIGGHATVGNAAAAKTMDGFYIDKVEKLRANIPTVPSPTLDWPKSTAPFSFSFASAGKIVKTVLALKNTDALGLDGIPMSVLKKGIDVLASPIAHLINRSLASGVVPSGFKIGCVIPIHKGKGKNTTDPALYRPISILPPLSKVLEAVVKTDLERHLAVVDALPNTQFGFRAGRSSTAAIATSHAQWLRGSQQGNVVGILAFDLSSAFDTVDKELLLPKLAAMGIAGTTLKWFDSYLSGGQQCVDWSGTRSGFAKVRFRVRQGSILGPILFLVLMADLPDCLNIGEDATACYADDVCIYAVAKDLASVGELLEERADGFTRFAAGNGLVLNASKTQLLIGGKAKHKDLETFSVMVDGTAVSPGKELELLGVKFDAKLTTLPHDSSVAASARQRAAMISRLALHLPRGAYLQQLDRGLLIGKVGYTIAAVMAPRLEGDTCEAWKLRT
jgi:hypothetical protein